MYCTRERTVRKLVLAEVFCRYPEIPSGSCCLTCSSHDDGVCVIK